jgi:hypothetical protein
MADYITDIIDRYEAELQKVQRDGYAFRFVKEQTYELCLAAGKQNVYALQFIKDLQIKEKIRLELNL